MNSVIAITMGALATFFCLIGTSDAFLLHPPSGGSCASSALNLNLGGFFGGKKSRPADEVTSTDDKGLKDFFVTMDSVETAQKVGKATSSLLAELQQNTVEGQAQDGKVKVTFNCQQRPLRVSIDPGFFAETDAKEMAQSLTIAMHDAHLKSIEKMEEKMKQLYSELDV